MKLFGVVIAMLMLVPFAAFAQEDQETDHEAAFTHSHITHHSYYIHTPVDTDFATTVENVRAALKEEGFGILTEIDFSATMKDKLDEDTPPCLILGACNPGFAWEVFQSEPWIGVEMPCNAVIRELADGSVEVAIKNPAMLAEATGNDDLGETGAELVAKITRILETVAHQ